MTRPFVSLLAAAALAGVSGCGAAAGPGAAARSQAASPAAAAGPVYFVQQTGASPPSRSGGAQGVLTLDPQGCFRLGQGGPALVWPSQAALDLTEPGVVRVLQGGTGEAVRVGERVLVSATPAPPDAALNRPLGPCGEAVWAVASFEPRARSAG